LTKIRAIISHYSTLPLHARSLTTVFFSLFLVLHLPSVGVNTTKMFIQVFLSREAFAGESLAIWMRAIKLLSRATVEIVHLPLMSQ
jgi:hypothetical protein